MTQIIKQDGTMEGLGSVRVLDANGRAKINAHLLDGLHADDTGAADAHVVATDASGNAKVGGQVTQTTNVIRAVFTKTGIADNSATSVFTITTTNESGDNDGGAYTCFVHAMAIHPPNLPAQASRSAKGYMGHFTLAQRDTGATALSAVQVVSETAVAAVNSGYHNMTTVTMTVVNTTDYVKTVQFTVDLTGSDIRTAGIVVSVELIWHTYLTPPVMTAA